jgi:hypothetical protein
MNRFVPTIALVLFLLSEGSSQNSATAEFETAVRDTVQHGSVAWGGGHGSGYSAVILTEAGFYLTSAGEGTRFVTSAGLLLKTGDDDAVGPAMFLGTDEALAYGLELRYRHWFGEHHFFDLGVGMPLYVENSGPDLLPSPYFQVRWNPVDWLGFSVRPEYRRRTDNHYFRDIGYRYVESGKWVVSGGIEIGGQPGVIIQGVVAFLLVIAFGTYLGGG